MQHIDTDYLIIGSGTAGLAFADTLIAETDATVTIVDRHGKPGGHWNDAYFFVTLHQPSAFYGVNSMALVYHPMCNYLGDGQFEPLLSGARTQVTVRKKLVDGTYYSPAVPSTHSPRFSVAPGVRMLPPNNLPRLWHSQGGQAAPRTDPGVAHLLRMRFAWSCRLRSQLRASSPARGKLSGSQNSKPPASRSARAEQVQGLARSRALTPLGCPARRCARRHRPCTGCARWRHRPSPRTARRPCAWACPRPTMDTTNRRVWTSEPFEL